jgi:hypothetical protein
LISPLAQAANVAIDAATNDTTYVDGRTEPSLVARLVASLPHLLVNEWLGAFPAGELHVTSVFCHHMPQAHWDSLNGLGPGRSELCDLLLLVVSPDASGAFTEHALLIQAKNGTLGQATLSTTGDYKQRYMYTSWPDFHIAGGACNGTALPCMPFEPRYDIRKAGPDGTRYGIVKENQNPSWYLESSVPTWSPKTKQGKLHINTFDDVGAMSISAQLSLGEAIEEMVNKSLGHPLNDIATPHWDHVVGILMLNAMESQYKTKLTSVQHTKGAPLVPLSAACSLFTTHPYQSPSPPFTRHWNFWHPLGSASTKHLLADTGGLIITTPPEDRKWENLDRGYGIIRIVVGGRFTEDAIRKPSPGEPTKM